jgi:hypothetical protein
MSKGKIYNLNSIVVHVEDLIEEYEALYQHYMDEIEYLFLNKDTFKKKELRMRYRRLAYLMNSHTIDITETMKKCNDYLFLNNHGTVSDCDVVVDVDEFKHIRKQFKKNHLANFKKVYGFVKEAKKGRNFIAHTLAENLHVFPIMQKENVLRTLNKYLDLFNKLGLTNEVAKASKRKQDMENNRGIVVELIMAMEGLGKKKKKA